MRKVSKVLVATAMAVTVLALANPTPTVMAASKGKKSKVVYTLKKGTLTVSGKGEMPKKMTFKNNKKIKKVVIKKGVTSISDRAFYKCKNLSKVTIGSSVKKIGTDSFNGTKIKNITVPKGVKEIGQDAFDNCKSLNTITLPGKYKLKNKKEDEGYNTIMNGTMADTVTFSTDLDLKTVTYVNSNAFNVSAKDRNYTSKSGLIYSKDGKALVRVPAGTKELSIDEGCENFSLQSILYGRNGEDGIELVCEKLEKIRIPESVKKITINDYKAGDYCENLYDAKDVVINAKDLDVESIENLCNRTNVATLKSVAKQVPDVKVENEMYISKEGVLLGYDGNGEKLVIPEGINTIAEKVLFQNEKDVYNLKEVVMPDTVVTIQNNAFIDVHTLNRINWSKNLETVGDKAFSGCRLDTLDMPVTVKKWGKGVFEKNRLEKLTISTSIKEIPESMFRGCEALKEVSIPDNIEVIGENAFSGCEGLVKVEIGKNVKTINSGAFALTRLQEVVIPKNVTDVKYGAFSECHELEKVTIEGKTTIANGAFDSDSDVVLDYRTGAKYNKANINLYSVKKSKNKYITMKTEWNKIKGVSGYEVKVATDSRFKKNTKTVKVIETKIKATVKIKVKDLKKIKKVYVKVTPYTYVNGTKVYGLPQTDSMRRK